MAVLSPAEQNALRLGRLAASVDLPAGKVKRWGPDEHSTADILAGLNFTTSDPGGFKDSNFGLARDIDIEWPDLGLLYPLRLYGAGGALTAWEGRLQERPGHHADDELISPGAVGWSAHLEDAPFQEIYIDRELSKWVEPTIQRRLNLLAATYSLAATVSVAPKDAGNDGSSLVMDFTDVSATETWKEGQELMYYGNGVDLGYLWFDQIGDVTTGWTKVPVLSSDDVLTSVDGAVNYSGVAESLNQSVVASSAGRKYAVFNATNLGAFVGKMTNFQRWRNVMVMGRHGLTIRGTWPGYGFYASDVIADVVGRFAPELSYTTGSTGSIKPTEYIIPQLAFSEPTKPAEAIMQANAYHQWSWGVEDNRTFFYRPTSSYRKRWRIRRSHGDQVELLGPQADAAINGVVVTFTDPAGVTRVVGPPELKTAYATSEALADTRSTNPVNRAGIARKWGELQLGFVTDVSGAIAVGAAWFAEKLSNSQARGSVTAVGVVQDEHGAFYPSWAMRAGDSATVVDGDGVERRIIETNYSHDSRACQASLDSTPHKTEALMERMGIALVGVTE